MSNCHQNRVYLAQSLRDSVLVTGQYWKTQGEQVCRRDHCDIHGSCESTAIGPWLMFFLVKMHVCISFIHQQGDQVAGKTFPSH